MSFLEYLNKQHPIIKFTFEKEIMGKLDVHIDKNNVSKFSTLVYRKYTFTGFLNNFTSFVPLSYKLALVKTLHGLFFTKILMN